MSDPNPPKSCGTCKWFHPRDKDRYPISICGFHLPDMVVPFWFSVGELQRWVRPISGADCRCHAPKEQK